MNEIIIKLDEYRNVIAVEGIPAGTPVKILRKKALPVETRKAKEEEHRALKTEDKEPPHLQWFACVWHVLAGRTYVKCYREAEARQLAVKHADDGGLVKLEDGRRVRHEWYNTTDEEPYIDSVDQDEDTLQEGAEIDRESGL